MAPNANTHLLTARDYVYAPGAAPAPSAAPAAPGTAPAAPSTAPAPQHLRHAEYGGGLQLDLGDGATHTPRPGSRAQRAAHSARHRDNTQALSCVRTRNDDDELRAAIELSVIRAYSSLAGASAARNRHYADLLPSGEIIYSHMIQYAPMYIGHAHI
ncbi:PREDICTED: uncharacterized protein LOC106106370 [Papilio polytes]|uniref:uncharacterized protein LOC106106370 n=1 Tax=Papilio polytes TaxID=76194 RepID=UPI0006762235|nr:PREDICTED: uncharacterized protein LOC106106370 [Papilio polytes]